MSDALLKTKLIAVTETGLLLYVYVTVEILQNLHPPGINNRKVKARVVEIVCSIKSP